MRSRDATLGQLALDDDIQSARAAVRPDSVEQDAGVAHELAAVGALAPLYSTVT